MEPLIISLDERLASAGDALPLAGHLDLASYELGDHEFALPEGVDYDLVLTNAGEGILATGIVRAHAVGTCDRCLECAELDIAGEVDGYYLFEEPERSPRTRTRLTSSSCRPTARSTSPARCSLPS